MESNKLRILIISHGHPALSIGGGENAAFSMFRELQRREGCEALFMAVHQGARPPHLGSSFATLSPDGSEVLFYPGPLDWFSFSQLDLTQVWQDFRALLETFQPSLVHFHHYVGLGIEFIREVRNYSATVPIVLTLHEYLAICHQHGQMVKPDGYKLCYESSPANCQRCFPEKSVTDFKLRELYIKSFFKLVDCFIAPSRFLLSRYVEWGIPREKLIFQENGQPQVTPAPPRPLATGGLRNRFAYFGQYTPYKGLTVLLEALTRLPQDSDLEIFVDINASNLENWPETFQSEVRGLLNQASRFARFKGPYRGEELPSLMSRVDWVVVPSIWWENSPLVIQEAFSHRRPVICSDIGGMAEKVKPYETGLHFRVGDAEDLARRLVEAATTTDLWDSLHLAIVPPPTIVATCDRLLEVYDRLLKARAC